MHTVRTRFAPSPTGYIHVGGIRTALFAWLIARQAGGTFILRIEDTDKKREVEGSIQHIMDSLGWLGLDWDEGPGVGGPQGPYRQSERLDIYRKWAEKMVAAGRAYADPYTPEEVQSFREQAQAEKRPFLYRNHRPEDPPVWDGSQPLRFRSDPKAYTWHDEIMGDIRTGPEVIDDIVIMKSDGFPTYNFAHIVDDAEMNVSHIIRGQEFIASVPNYLNIYEALDLEAPMMATVPPVLGPDRKKKLSKRDGAKDILEYREEGYLPEAMVNFLATLGWNDGTEQEVFTTDELIKKFRLDRVQKSGAAFDERRLLWLNGAHIRKLPLEYLYRLTGDKKGPNFFPPEADNYDDAYRQRVLGVVQERLKFFEEIPELTSFFFVDDLPQGTGLIDSHKQLKKLERSELIEHLRLSIEELKKSDFDTPDLTHRLNGLLETTGQKPAVLFSLLRIAITQAPASPGLADTLNVLGKERSLRRLEGMLEALAD
jgi:glutamyl-tRNA synthetase